MAQNLLKEKYSKLKKLLNSLDSVLIAFSGGLDSSVLCKVAFDCLGNRALAVTAKSATYSPKELIDARLFTKSIGIKHIVIKTAEFKNKKFLANSKDRCYWCKKELFFKLSKISKRFGIKHILDGTNYDDRLDLRPGLKANREFKVISPLYTCGLTKKDIRILSRKFGFNYLKPQSACLASRIPFGDGISRERLAKIKKAENLLKSYLGEYVLLRARDHKDILRIEIENKDWTKLDKSDINNFIRKLKNIGYKYITLDLEGYIPAGLRA